MSMFVLLSYHPILAFVGLTFAFLSYIVVRSYTTGLNGIKGPLAAKFTDAWRVIQVRRLQDQRENYQIAVHRKYGDVVRIGPRSVSVNDPEAIQTVLGLKARLNKVRRCVLGRGLWTWAQIETRTSSRVPDTSHSSTLVCVQALSASQMRRSMLSSEDQSPTPLVFPR